MRDNERAHVVWAAGVGLAQEEVDARFTDLRRGTRWRGDFAGESARQRQDAVESQMEHEANINHQESGSSTCIESDGARSMPDAETSYGEESYYLVQERRILEALCATLDHHLNSQGLVRERRFLPEIALGAPWHVRKLADA
ncbi:hypothetical protein BD626DRAFT_567797 [Schizophyllum amplum]|uniref:Uncharacterized protein n=1 Tax=Schizophyllum amplum TaxID=97359 RepID=A0A550CJK1_9AGAR|nr:hypothetical protein BD626DRAFT_567797 [Auriculariopsis ampla]